MNKKASGKTKVSQKSGYHHGQLRDSLVNAGLTILSKDGVGGLSLRAVARAVGVSQAAPYRHFADKDALVAEIARQGFLRLTTEMRAMTAKHRNPDRQLIEAGWAYVRFALENPDHLRVMFTGMVDGSRVHAELQAASQESFGELVQIIIGGQEKGVIRAGDPVQSALTAWSLVHGLSMLFLNGQISAEQFGVASEDSLARFCIQMLKDGWKPRNGN
jgi:AcrR family transcriptional regulator